MEILIILIVGLLLFWLAKHIIGGIIEGAIIAISLIIVYIILTHVLFFNLKVDVPKTINNIDNRVNQWEDKQYQWEYRDIR